MDTTATSTVDSLYKRVTIPPASFKICAMVDTKHLLNGHNCRTFRHTSGHAATRDSSCPSLHVKYCATDFTSCSGNPDHEALELCTGVDVLNSVLKSGTDHSYITSHDDIYKRAKFCCECGRKLIEFKGVGVPGIEKDQHVVENVEHLKAGSTRSTNQGQEACQHANTCLVQDRKTKQKQVQRRAASSSKETEPASGEQSMHSSRGVNLMFFTSSPDKLLTPLKSSGGVRDLRGMDFAEPNDEKLSNHLSAASVSVNSPSEGLRSAQELGTPQTPILIHSSPGPNLSGSPQTSSSEDSDDPDDPDDMTWTPANENLTTENSMPSNRRVRDADNLAPEQSRRVSSSRVQKKGRKAEWSKKVTLKLPTAQRHSLQDKLNTQDGTQSGTVPVNSLASWSSNNRSLCWSQDGWAIACNRCIGKTICSHKAVEVQEWQDWEANRDARQTGKDGSRAQRVANRNASKGVSVNAPFAL